MSRSRILFAFVSVAALACSSDRPTDPSKPLATRLNEIADSSAERQDYRVANALYAASAVVNAGGRVSSVQLVIDSQPRAFNAVAMRLTYSPAACDQLKQMFMTMSGGMYEGDTSYIGFEEAMCRPAQMFIAWDTDDMRRIAIVQGDTGTTTMDLNLWEPMSFWGEFYDRDARKEWWMIEGSQSNALLRDRGTCRSFSIPEGGMDVSCRLATLRQSFDMTLEEWEIYEYDDDYGYDTLYYDDSTNIRPRAPRAPRALTVRDTTYGDTGIVVDTTYWAPYVTHTMALRATALEGLALTVKQFNFEEGGYYRRMARKAALRNARLQRARPIVIP